MQLEYRYCIFPDFSFQVSTPCCFLLQCVEAGEAGCCRRVVVFVLLAAVHTTTSSRPAASLPVCEGCL